ncbi:TRAP-type C4-dicarboxylate transport system permease small subunit [Anaerospora hongkongensis]|uniref:TRAP-type C4-dicarboxylate transport system permease small subunit n=1 Tax=Anaerospora hongkongensis TaxID=244830 RepID=A0A4R1PZA7_9FIRM|nr:TRAP transporter small permease [Anaerospora hongkongensis]TCL37620.1 TRAP-type C4-dicarboxylate transport system permease small subunit [Anaerospora hongkongensis]
MKYLRKAALVLDSFFENFAIISLLGVIIIMIVQVATRKLFNFVFFWSEEAILLSLVWFSFMGIAIGFREGVHMGVEALTDRLPPVVNKWIDKWIDVMGLLYGLYFVVYGWEFTVLMFESTLPATKLPNSVVYLVMPVSGVMVCAYCLLQLLGIDTKRHKGADIEIGGDTGVGQ